MTSLLNSSQSIRFICDVWLFLTFCFFQIHAMGCFVPVGRWSPEIEIEHDLSGYQQGNALLHQIGGHKTMTFVLYLFVSGNCSILLFDKPFSLDILDERDMSTIKRGKTFIVKMTHWPNFSHRRHCSHMD